VTALQQKLSENKHIQRDELVQFLKNLGKKNLSDHNTLEAENIATSCLGGNGGPSNAK